MSSSLQAADWSLSLDKWLKTAKATLLAPVTWRFRRSRCLPTSDAPSPQLAARPEQMAKLTICVANYVRDTWKLSKKAGSRYSEITNRLTRSLE